MKPETHSLSIGSAGCTYPRLRRLAIDTAITWVFNLVIALFITYLMPTGSPFWVNLVFSMCIGTLAVWMIDGGKLLLWGEGKPSWTIFLLIAAAMPLAYYGGHALAVWLLGMPAQHLSHAFDMRYSGGTLVITLLACLFGTWIFWSRARLQELEAQAVMEKARAAATEKQALQAQLQLLQAQIEPHMLFNTLANLQALIAVDAPRAQHMLDQLIQYLRATLSAARAPQTTLAQEFALLQAYLELMAVRMGQRLAYALDLPEALHAVPLPPMLLQPLVENAIRHGLEPKIDGGRIDVVARLTDGMLELRIADTGLGLDVPSSQAGTSLGLANVRERLRALYGERATFSLRPNHPAGAGAIALITLPMTA
ncbi:sensor histidine kinase [Noviherbaspirillum sedimenti]|uniref:sensor histidine kinase n=1 Tax=Noviherbaspirillum sedimenti TaxID=2320865 RepID=UPI001F1FC331|nr:histidine kinase [Noviherbaspirillum sedimenti]